MTKEKSKRFQVTVSSDVFEKLEEIRSEMGVSKSNAIAFLINEKFNQMKEDIRA